MKLHELKTWPEAFVAVQAGDKTFEVRRNDRAFVRGDMLDLREWDPKLEIYTGRRVQRRVAYILDGGRFGVEAGFVVMALAVPVERSIEIPATAGELAGWHHGRAQNARLRAAGHRGAASGDAGVGAARYMACAEAADQEAAFHDAAASLALAASGDGR